MTRAATWIVLFGLLVVGLVMMGCGQTAVAKTPPRWAAVSEETTEFGNRLILAQFTPTGTCFLFVHSYTGAPDTVVRVERELCETK